MSNIMFIGSTEEYEQLEAKQRKEQGLVEKKQEAHKKVSSHKLIPPVSEDIKNILKRTIVPDLTYVHVKSNIDDIDKFYHNRGNTVIDKNLYEAARKIKRLYKSYPEYTWAIRVYNDYITALIDKYGSKQNMRLRMINGGLEDWMPPTPLYSASAPDYELAKEGIMTVSIYNEDEDLYDGINQEMMENLLDELIPPIEEVEDMEVVADVETDLFVYANYDGSDNISSRRSNRSASNIGRVNISDLAELQTLFKKNITGVTEDSSKPVQEHQYLSKDPETMRERFYTEKAMTLQPGGYERLCSDEEEEEDPNRMIKDSTTRKYMTLAEYKARQVIRMMGQEGWNEVKLLQKLGVGNKYEIESLKKKNKNKKKNAKLSDATVSGLLKGTELEIFTTTDDMQKYLFND